MDTFSKLFESVVEIDDSAYHRNYGHLPKGKGSWVFFPDKDRDDMDGAIWVPVMTFTAAKKVAKRQAKELGYDTIYVGT